jgi:hypothetical protein
MMSKRLIHYGYVVCFQSTQITEIYKQIAEITALHKNLKIYKVYGLREELPGIILRLPNLVKNALLYYRAYKAGKR